MSLDVLSSRRKKIVERKTENSLGDSTGQPTFYHQEITLFSLPPSLRNDSIVSSFLMLNVPQSPHDTDFSKYFDARKYEPY